MSLSINSIDLAKHGFSIHGEDHQDKVLIHKTISSLIYRDLSLPSVAGATRHTASGGTHYNR